MMGARERGEETPQFPLIFVSSLPPPRPSPSLITPASKPLFLVPGPLGNLWACSRAQTNITPPSSDRAEDFRYCCFNLFFHHLHGIACDYNQFNVVASDSET